VRDSDFIRSVVGIQFVRVNSLIGIVTWLRVHWVTVCIPMTLESSGVYVSSDLHYEQFIDILARAVVWREAVLTLEAV